MRATLLFITIAIAIASASGENTPGTEQEVRAAIDRFLRAFEDLDMSSFTHCFAEDASVFFPVPEPARRFDGKRAIQTHFEEVFAAIRQSSASPKPPFHRLIPEDLQVRLLGDASAVVTFQMSNAVRIARRTLVLQKGGDSWFIVHLHASNVAVSVADPSRTGSGP